MSTESSLNYVSIDIPTDLHWNLSTETLSRIGELSDQVFILKFNEKSSTSTYQVRIKSADSEEARIAHFKFMTETALKSGSIVLHFHRQMSTLEGESTEMGNVFVSPLAQTRLSTEIESSFKCFLRQRLRTSFDELSEACTNDDLNKLEGILHKGVNLSARNKKGETALHIAANNDSVSCMRFLLEKGIPIDSVDYRGMTPLHCTCWNGKMAAYRFLLEKGADPNALNDRGSNIFLLATVGHGRNTAFMQEIMSNHPQLIGKSNKFGVTAAHGLVQSGNAFVLDLILGTYPNLVYFKDNHQITPLHNAAAKGDIDSICVLMKYGARLRTIDGWLESPMITACFTNQPKSIMTLRYYREQSALWFYPRSAFINATTFQFKNLKALCSPIKKPDSPYINDV
ncbi:ankyrin repeat domain-containing protein [Parashewanella curva]|uniref:Ankyrin repeat domain-containing protein n=1 Tax=Parashewanella curva TaxID=2338552 RepID=A0A3L8PQP8_9GAMM|nr:ankyrin repeat domain-containing protein [Parashewanella curva]RLV57701.1 ankyrin repeat domain-containing protein [Parashewanella curva]